MRLKTTEAECRRKLQHDANRGLDWYEAIINNYASDALEAHRLRRELRDILDEWHFDVCDDDHQLGASTVCNLIAKAMGPK